MSGEETLEEVIKEGRGKRPETINEDVFNIVHRNFDLNHRNIYIGHQNPLGAGMIINERKPLHILQFVVSGYGGYYLGGQGFFQIKPGTIFYLPKGEKVSYWPNTSEPYEYYYIGLDVLEGDVFFRQLGFSKENPVGYFDDERIFSKIADAHENFRAQTLTGGFGGLSDIYKVFEILSEKNGAQSVPQGGNNPYVEKALVYINGHYMEDINVNRIADEICLNRCYFSVLFKKYTGVSVPQYLTELRVSQACRLLATDKTITEVATLSGFNSATLLGIHFKKLVKMTPLEYKKYLRNE